MMGIPGIRVRPVKAKEMNHRGQREALHLFAEENMYALHTNGKWIVWPPGWRGDPIHLDPKTHTVVEHDDGTATITGPAFATPDGSFQLVKGEWVAQ